MQLPIDQKISVIIPAFNEEENIKESILETVRSLTGLTIAWEIIVFDDGSQDKTYEQACSLQAEFPNRIIVKRNTQNIGKGRAIKKAVHYASGDYIVFIDADLDLHPRQIKSLFEVMFLKNSDVVIGSKLHPDSVVDYPLQRRIMSLAYYFLIRLLFNLPCRDTQTGLKLFKRETALRVFHLVLVRQFAFDLEVLANVNNLGYFIAEAPIYLSQKRRYGRIGMNAAWVTFIDTLAVFYRMRILKYYDRVDHNRSKR